MCPNIASLNVHAVNIYVRYIFECFILDLVHAPSNWVGCAVVSVCVCARVFFFTLSACIPTRVTLQSFEVVMRVCFVSGGGGGPLEGLPVCRVYVRALLF